jgi:hypothetical protein
MVLIHDDDLARIAKIRDDEVSRHFDVSVGLIFAIIGNPSIGHIRDFPPKLTAGDTRD